SGDRCGAACGRRLSGGHRGGPPPRDSPADARGGAGGGGERGGGGGSRLKTLLVGARQIVTCRGPARARRGGELADLEVLQDAAVLIDGERIAWVGPRSDARDLHSAFRIPPSAIDVVEGAGVLFPGFVDCHTHAVFGAP